MARDVVVVLNYRRRADTERCVESLVGAGGSSFRVIVVDNGSDDGVLRGIHDRWPGVEGIQLEENLGFSGGMNAGLRHALSNGAETVTVLNNDTIVPAGAIEALSDRARSGLAVSPEVRYADGSERVWFGGGAVDRDTNLAHHLSDAQLRDPGPDGLRVSETLAGCCITAGADTWRSVGLFDERYFLNFEDSDWSLRATSVGVALAVDTNVHIQHQVSASFTGAYSYLGLYYYARNGLLFGRDRCRGSWIQAARFLRRQVVPQLAGRARRHQWRDLTRETLVCGVALQNFARGRFGAAPDWLLVRTSRWASGR